MEQFHKLRNQIPRIEQAAEHRHHERAERERPDRALLTERRLIANRRGQHERAADKEVREVADEGRRRALDKQLEQNFQKLADHAADRAEIECADHDRQLAEVELIERRRDGQREIKDVQDGGNGGEHGDTGDGARGVQAVALLHHKALGQICRQNERRRHHKADEHKGEVFFQACEKVCHNVLLSLQGK